MSTRPTFRERFAVWRWHPWRSGPARWRRVTNSPPPQSQPEYENADAPSAAAPGSAACRRNRLEGILPRSRTAGSASRARWLTTATCASPRSTSRRRAPSTASSARSSCRPSTPRATSTNAARARERCREPGRASSLAPIPRASACRRSSSICSDACAACAMRRSRTTSVSRRTRTAAQLLLVSEVANAWLTLIADRELLRLAYETRDSQRKSYDLTKLRFDAGRVQRNRTASFRESVARSRSRHRAADAARGAGSQCAGAAGGRAAAARDRHAANAPSKRRHLRRNLPAGLPAELLVRRPGRARRRARAQGGQCRYRRGARGVLPEHRAHRFLWQGQRRSVGVVPVRAHGLEFHAAGTSADFLRRREPRRDSTSPTCASASRSRVTSSRSRSHSAKWPMRWSTRSTLDDQLRAQEALTRASESSYRLADMRYRGGVDSYLGALIAQRDLYTAQRR